MQAQAGGRVLPEHLRQRLREVLRPRVLDHLEGRAEARLLARILDRVAEASDLVDKPELLRLGAGPHPALRDLLDEGRLQVAALGDLRDELAVDPVHHPLEDLHLLVGLRPLDRDRVRELPRLHAVEGDAVLVRELLDVELDPEDPYRPRDGRRLGEDPVPVGGDPVPCLLYTSRCV